jgi:ribose 5-phosphate isomerase A
LIKGGGAALTLEKILTYYSKLNVFVVDYSKLVNDLHNEFIPVDVLPQALTLLTRYLGRLGYEFSIRYSGKGRYGPVLSDVGGVIIDVKLPPNEDLVSFEKSIKSLPGVIEVGLFIGLTDVLIIGYEDRVERLRGRRLYSVYSSSRTA